MTVAQVLTLLAFLANSPHLRELAWATTAIAIYAIWDYYHVAPRAGQRGWRRCMTAETKRAVLTWSEGFVFRGERPEGRRQ